MIVVTEMSHKIGGALKGMHSLYRSDESVAVHQRKEYSFHSRTRKNIELIIYLQGLQIIQMEIILNLLKPKGGFRTGKENFMEFESQIECFWSSHYATIWC